MISLLGACGIKGVKPNVLNKSQDFGSRIIDNKSCVLTLSLGAILVRVIFACSVSVEFVSHCNIVMGHASHLSALSLYSSDIFDLS